MTKEDRPTARSVRRRLVFDDDVTEASVENFTNILQESLDSCNREKMEKWNFDFQNDRPLDGVYEWTIAEGPYDWVGEKTNVKSSDEDDEVEMQKVNESTPKVKEGDELRTVRKRKVAGVQNVAGSGAKRKISFN